MSFLQGFQKGLGSFGKCFNFKRVFFKYVLELLLLFLGTLFGLLGIILLISRYIRLDTTLILMGLLLLNILLIIKK